MSVKVPKRVSIVILASMELLGLCVLFGSVIQLAGSYLGRDIFHLNQVFGLRAVPAIVMFSLVTGMLYSIISLALLVGVLSATTTSEGLPKRRG